MDQKPKDTPYWATEEFKELSKEWDQKLENSGFKDEETTIDGERVLKQQASNVYRQADVITKEAKLKYYQQLSSAVQKDPPTDPIHKIIMTMTAEGATIKEIVKVLAKKKYRLRAHGAIDRHTVGFIRRRYEMKWGIKHWNPKQLNLTHIK